MTLLHLVALALLQGLTELFPISSLGHAVIAPRLLRWPIDEQADWFLPLLVVMHLGTAAALLLYFWRDWLNFALAVFLGRGRDPQGERRIFVRVVVATLPAVVVGLLLEKPLRHVFGSPLIAAAFLVLNGVLLFAADRMRRGSARPLRALGVLDALVIGIWQCLALIPGISRSGATMVGGYRAGLSHADAARFSFLTATPVILGAGVLEVPKLLKRHALTAGAGLTLANPTAASILAGVLAGLAAFASLVILMRWFKSHEFRAFTPFAVYCVLAGLTSLALLSLGL